MTASQWLGVLILVLIGAAVAYAFRRAERVKPDGTNPPAHGDHVRSDD
jgi:hypothetical protein